MSGKVPTPLSVVTLGNSVAFMQVRHGDNSTMGTYSDVLAAELEAAGIPNTVALEGKWFDFIHKGVRDYETRVRPHRPNVLIVNYGLNESQPWLAPVWLVAHLLKKESATTKTGKFYRRNIADRLWKLVRKLRRLLAKRIGMLTWQCTPYRFERCLRRLILIARHERSCLVLVLDINPPGAMLTHFLPGQVERHAVYQQLIEKIVDDHKDPQVRLVRSSEICAKLGVDESMPDGMHLSPAGHYVLGKELAAEVLAWHAQTDLGQVLPDGVA